MQLPPVEVYLTWPQPNYANPSDVRGPAVLVLTMVFVPLLVLVVALRTYTRLRLTKNFGPDDIVIVAALLPTFGCAVITVLAVLHYGWNRHIWDVPIDQIEMSLKLALAVEVLFSFACSLTRLSILLLICRIMSGGSGFLRRLSIAMMVLLCIEELVFCVVAINTCSPVSDYWTLSIEPQKCINEAVHILIAGIINTINDFCVVLIPIPVVLNLRLPLRQRIVCALLFGAGFIVCIAGGIRIYYMYQLNTTYDKTWLAYPAWICGTIELYLGIIATSIPAIKPLVTRYFPNILGHNFLKSYGQSSHVQMENGEIFVKNRSSKSPISDMDLTLAKSPTLHSVSTEKTATHAKSKPLILSPVISSFSTYQKDLSPTETSAEWKRSHPPIEEGHSSGTSISSFDATWTPK